MTGMEKNLQEQIKEERKVNHKMRLTKTNKKFYLTKLFYTIDNHPNKIWLIDTLLKDVNYLIPSNISLSRLNLFKLISDQLTYKVFKCRSKLKNYYFFKRGEINESSVFTDG